MSDRRLQLLTIGCEDIVDPDTLDARWQHQSAVSLSAAEQRIRLGDYPDLIVVALHWPEQYHAAELATVRRLAPLARWLCILGPWSVGAARTTPLFEPATLTTAAELPSRLATELGALTGAGDPEVNLCLTSSRDEAFAAVRTAPRSGWCADQTIVVISPDFEWSELCRVFITQGGGWTSLTDQVCDGLWFDADPWNPERGDLLQRTILEVRPQRVIAWTGWDDAGLTGSLFRQGAHQVLLKTTPLNIAAEKLCG